jgi:hypothetical protein
VTEGDEGSSGGARGSPRARRGGVRGGDLVPGAHARGRHQGLDAPGGGPGQAPRPPHPPHVHPLPRGLLPGRARPRRPLPPGAVPRGTARGHLGPGRRVPRARPGGPHRPGRLVGHGPRLQEAAVGDAPRPRAGRGLGVLPRRPPAPVRRAGTARGGADLDRGGGRGCRRVGRRPVARRRAGLRDGDAGLHRARGIRPTGAGRTVRTGAPRAPPRPPRGPTGSPSGPRSRRRGRSGRARAPRGSRRGA